MYHTSLRHGSLGFHSNPYICCSWRLSSKKKRDSRLWLDPLPLLSTLTVQFERMVGHLGGLRRLYLLPRDRCCVIANWRGLGRPRMAVKFRGSGYPHYILSLLVFCRLCQKRSLQSNHGLLEYHEKLASRARTKSKRRVRVLTMT